MFSGWGRAHRTSLVDDLAEQLTRRIISGDYPPKSALPSLRSLAEAAGVSLLTAKEAVRVLQTNGLVESRQGSGTYVLSNEIPDKGTPWMLTPKDTEEFFELIEARQVIEKQIIQFAAERRDEQQLQRLEKIVADMERGLSDAEIFLEADILFHITLAEAAHNRILLRTMLAIRGPLKRYIAGRTSQHLKRKGNLEEAIRDHQDIVVAVRDKASATGIAALERIIDRGRRHLQSLEETNEDGEDT